MFNSNVLDDNVQELQSTSEETIGFYDKKKSFFDEISCEATQRNKGFVKILKFIALNL